MADFTEHISQANRNLTFLEKINTNVEDCYDWQVTTSFYTGVHLVNAHIASQINQHYRSHEDVDNCLNPFKGDAKCRLSQDAYLNYKKLQGLSRRSRYLCSESFDNKETRLRLTFDKHLYKAMKNLDALIFYLNQIYPGRLIKNRIKLKCPGLTRDSLKFFEVIV